MRKPFAAACLVVATLAACGGALDRTSSDLSRSEDQPEGRSGSAGPGYFGAASGEADTSPVAVCPHDDDAFRDGDAGPPANACAAFEPIAYGDGGVIGGSGGLRCRVAVGVTTHGYADDAGNVTTYPMLAMADGTTGAARRTGGDLVLTCSDGCVPIFRARLRCFSGSGSYRLAPGDLELGGRASDRTCEVDVDISSGDEVRGFVECSAAPYSAANVFANSGPPVGLGHFDLPVTN